MAIIRTPDVLLGTLEQGELVKDLQAEISKVMVALADLGEHGAAKGSITLKIDFAVENSLTEINTELTSKLPKPRRRKTMLFVTPEGELSTEHPKQTDLFAGPRDAAERMAR